MAPQRRGLDDGPEDDNLLKPTPTPVAKPQSSNTLSMASPTLDDLLPEVTSSVLQWPHQHGPKISYTGDAVQWVPTDFPNVPAASILTIVMKPSSWLEAAVTTTQAVVGPSPSTQTAPEVPEFTGGSEFNGPDPFGAKDPLSNGGILAAFAVAPVVALLLIGAMVFLCLRKRKKQRLERAVAGNKVEEMRMQSRNLPTAQPYVASALAPRAAHHLPPSNTSASPPIILGPIPSGTDGAYFTGMDTSDVISMTSASNVRPAPLTFSDNDSFTEPPPPYRPRSAAPPSLTNTSRQSSMRASVAPPATSRTQLIERSPFDDPEDGDDVVSELSGPTGGRGDDALSAVSDLSYQNDPVVNRSSL